MEPHCSVVALERKQSHTPELCIALVTLQHCHPLSGVDPVSGNALMIPFGVGFATTLNP